ncbi:carrier superfamily protein [Acanthamoeba castellanii str. Neff]|uniref:Carrier superfamily protein n=1 Tax=Acanthamoeba castellanii (strain ATCC 30010 / Neff) TaxID=1257118 RepID=L8GM32_ACACF|nr:carrier superfamily protein [Acanthamoeba castellanii str. Neff]ELR14052.1 carrier superfamily protein [Acanthamoeba castellanii str. Neff]
MKGGTGRQMSESAWEKTAKDLFAGSVAGMVSLAVCYPLDIVRTRLQTTDASRFNGVIDCFAKTVKGEGFLALYKGMSSPLAAQALQKAIMFGAYGAAQRFIVGGRDRGTTSSPQPLSTFELLLCGMFAGSVNTVVAAPIELVRNRLMTQYHAKAASGAADATFYTGPIDCCKKIVQQHGLRGLWRGVGPTLLRDGPGVGAWYASFEFVKRLLIPEGKTAKDLGFSRLLLAGAAGGVGYWVTAFPQDTIKSVMQTDKAGKYRNMAHCAQELFREGGVPRFYRGFLMGITRGVPGAAATFATYSIIMDAIA